MDHCRAMATITIWDLQGQNSGHAVDNEECEADCSSRSCELCVKNWGKRLQFRPCVLVFCRSASCAVLCASMLQFCSVTSHDLRVVVAFAPTQPHATFMFRCAGIVDVLCSSLCSCIACSYLCCREWCERVVCPECFVCVVHACGVHGGRVAGFRHRIGFAGRARAKARLLVLLSRCCVH